MLALDFDGVIADSSNECLVTAHNTYSRYLGAYDPRYNLEHFDQALLEKFHQTRPLIRRGEDFVYLLQAIHAGVDLNLQQDFDDFVANYTDRREQYREIFYLEREKFQRAYPAEWLGLNKFYPGMVSFLKKRLVPGDTIIVTTKDIRSVGILLEQYGVKFKSSNLFQATREYRKPDIVNEIIKTRHWIAESSAFIDDHVATVLEMAQNSQVRSYCAAWGYNTEEQRRNLDNKEISVIDLDQFLNHFGGLKG